MILLYEGLYKENAAIFAAVRDWFVAVYPDHEKMIAGAYVAKKPTLAAVPKEEKSAEAA